ncbi:HNH endonuclease [Noviherbaspirillum sp.]|uniref:HNH endonuclease n=1 Tax=Noviherbaspirillum sp. TaxID=1926288 RepID=UPI0039C9E0AA
MEPLMPNSLRRTRSIAFERQRGRCFYCQAPTWLRAPDQFASTFRLTIRETRQLQATAEHLIARCDGGGNRRDNIVAACVFCNSRRHRRARPLEPEQYRLLVQKRLEKGCWHSPRIVEQIRNELSNTSTFQC